MSTARLAGDAAEALLAGYDAQSRRWAFAREGPFWEAVREAHRRGHTGRGRRAAVIDGAFDLSVPQLAEASGGAARQRAPFGEATAHGTLIALLVLAVAPDAALDLYAVTRDGEVETDAVAGALAGVAAGDASCVCLSLGADVPMAELAIDVADGDAPGAPGWKWSPAGPHWIGVKPAACAMAPCLCEAVRAAAGPGRVFVAAAGNSPLAAACPALSPDVLAIGFQLERREVTLPGVERAWAMPPQGYGQSCFADHTLMQVEGALGTSFAAPLMAGALLLGMDAAALPGFLEAAQRGALADLVQAELRQPGDHDPAKVAAMRAGYRSALQAFPRLPQVLACRHWCIGSALFGATLFANAGLAALGTGGLAEAEQVLRAALWLAPQSADAMANLARSLLARAEAGEGRARLPEALALYDAAIGLRPGYRDYDAARARVAAMLGA